MKQPSPPAQEYPAPVPVQVDKLPGVQYVPVQAQTVTSEQSIPSHNLVLTVVVTVICALVNVSSLIVGVAALFCAYKAYNALKEQRYSVTKSLGYAAAALSVFNIVYTGIITTIIVGLAVGCSPRKRYSYRYSKYFYSTDDRC